MFIHELHRFFVSNGKLWLRLVTASCNDASTSKRKRPESTMKLLMTYVLYLIYFLDAQCLIKGPLIDPNYDITLTLRQAIRA